MAPQPMIGMTLMVGMTLMIASCLGLRAFGGATDPCRIVRARAQSIAANHTQRSTK
jgi:hypothetical protein